MSSTLKMYDYVGEFAENKDRARELRLKRIGPRVQAGEPVTIDFGGVALATQSFMHALLSDVIRHDPAKALDLLSFKNCNKAVRSTITLVAEYTQDTLDTPAGRDGMELAVKTRSPAQRLARRRRTRASR